MKNPFFNRLTIATLLFAGLNTAANAQYNDSDGERYPKNVIRMNPASLILNNYSFFYERALPNDKMSVQLGGNYNFNEWSTGTNFNGTNYSGTLKNVGWGFTPEVRYYFLQDLTKGDFGQPAPYGVYIAGFGRYMRNNFTFNFKADNIDESMKFRTQVFTIGGMIGAQGIIAKTVAIDVFIGPDFNYATGKITDLPDVKIFEGDEIEWVDTNWLTNLMLNYLGKPSVSAGFPGVRAGISAGVAF